MIARRLALLVTGLVLFVDDDRAEIRERREHRGARADRHTAFAAAQRDPRIIALAVAQAGVKDRNLTPEHRAKAVHGLRRERDLGHEDDRRATLHLNHMLQQLDVDEGLSASGDAVEERDIAGWRCNQRRDRGALCGRRGHGLRRRGASRSKKGSRETRPRARRRPARASRDRSRSRASIQAPRTTCLTDVRLPSDLRRASYSARCCAERAKVFSRSMSDGSARVEHHDPARKAAITGLGPLRRAERRRRERRAQHEPGRRDVVLRHPPAHVLSRSGRERGLGVGNVVSSAFGLVLPSATPSLSPRQ